MSPLSRNLLLRLDLLDQIRHQLACFHDCNIVLKIRARRLVPMKAYDRVYQILELPEHHETERILLYC